MNDRKKRKGLSPRHSAKSRAVFDAISNAEFGGPHRYALARDHISDYEGEPWVPFNLWQQAKSPSRGSVVQACAKKLRDSPGAEALWAALAMRYERPDHISISLAVVCADAQAGWAAMPKLTPSSFKGHREELARQAEELASELERFNLSRDPDSHELPGLLDFTDLMTPLERDQLDHAIRVATATVVNRSRMQAKLPPIAWGEYNDIGDDARKLGYQNEKPYRQGYLMTPAREDAHAVYGLLLRDHTMSYPYGGVPTLPDMLRRIAVKFAEDAKDAPIARPNLANAERNFFTRFLCKYFWQSTLDISPAIIRDIVCMFYPAGIDENEVSQMSASVKAKFPPAQDPETSTRP